MSAESGIATFRGEDGTWNGADINTVCNYATWRENYHEVHEFYEARRKDIDNAVPNAAHSLLASLEERYEVTHVTQNIDNLLERAGCTSIIHLHGVHDGLICEHCSTEFKAINIPVDFREHCPACNAWHMLKPSVVFFNQPAPAYAKLYNIVEHATVDDIFVVIGTSNVVLDFTEILRHSFATHYEINPDPSFGFVYSRVYKQTASEGLKTLIGDVLDA